MNNIVKIALIFGSDFAVQIEQNPQRSQSYAEDFVIEGAVKTAWR